MNEVAYGCGCDYRNRAPQESAKDFDDAPAMARILQEGMALCKARRPAREFLSKLGVLGDDYASMEVLPLAGTPPRPSPVQLYDEEDSIVPEELCLTPARSSQPHTSATLPLQRKSSSLLLEPGSLKTPQVLKPAVPVQARGRSLSPQAELGRASSPCHQPTARYRCNSFEIPRSESMRFGLASHQNGAVTPLQNYRTVGRAPSSLHLALGSHTPQRSLVARAVSASKGRPKAQLEHNCRSFQSAARLGGC